MVVLVLVVVLSRDGDDSDIRPRAVNEVPKGISSDCSRPVETSLNRFLASVPDGSTVRLREGACYGIDGSVELADKVDFTLDGRGATIKTLTPGGERRANLTLRRGRNVSVVDLTVEGAFPGLAPEGPPGNGPRDGNITGTQHGVFVQSLHGGTITNVRALNNGGECVAIMSDFDPVKGFVGGPATDITIDRLDCSHTGRQGVSIIDGERIVLRNSKITDAHDCAIDIETDIESQVTRQILIEDNTFGTSRFAVICNGGQGAAPDVADITVARNTMTVPPSTCFGAVYVDTPPHHQEAGRARTGYKFIDNKLLSISYGFFLSGVDDMEISGNRIESLPGSGGCTDFSRTPPEAQPGVDARNVHGLRGSGNTWLNYQRIVRADGASRDIESLTDPPPTTTVTTGVDPSPTTTSR